MPKKKIVIAPPATKPVAVKKTAPAPKVVKAPKPAAVAVVKLAKKTIAPRIKASAPQPVVTVITAHIDIGFGNALYLRGEGAGLSWDTGQRLVCVDGTSWTIALPETAKPVVYKFLINDSSWSTGPDYVATPGARISVTPSF
jgi:hypothetical protein